MEGPAPPPARAVFLFSPFERYETKPAAWETVIKILVHAFSVVDALVNGLEDSQEGVLSKLPAFIHA